MENIEISDEETIKVVETPKLSQMEQDANYIKSTIHFIKPVNGVISSMFGLRNPTTASVPKNHTGTDIAAVKGTKIVSATEGTVIYTIKQGQEIAEVGSTGNTTGPHLHFEIRYQDRYVDPQLVLEL